MDWITGTPLLGIWVALLALMTGLIRRLGYRRGSAFFIALFTFLPFLNLLVLFYFSSTEWPLEKETRKVRMKNGRATESDLEKCFIDANAFETRNNIPAAIEECRLLLSCAANSKYAEEGEKLMAVLQKSMSQNGKAK